MVVVITVSVGSSNPAKIRSVQQALEIVLEGEDDVKLELKGYSVPSGVPDQPMGDDETKLGAKNRAQAAHDAYAKAVGKEPCFSFGLEGGLEEQNTELACMAWMAVYGKRTHEVLTATKALDCGDDFDIQDTETWSYSKTATFALPPMVTKLIKEDRKELGDATDSVFSQVQSKHGAATVGIVTNNIIDRSKYYEHALILALVPWIRPDVYPTGC